MGVTAKDNGGACFPLDFGITPTKGRQPPHPHRSGFFCSFHATCVPTCEWLATTDPPRLIALTSLPPTFIHFHPSNPTTPPRKKQHPLLVLPSVHTIINFATKFFDILTKKQFEHPLRVFQVFQVFRVFQVFHFAFGPQNSPFLVQIRTKPKNRYPPTSAIKWVRKTPKKAIHPPADEHDNVLQAIGAVFFRRSRLFFREADFFSGGEGCEWSAKQPTVGSEWGYNDENSFSALYPFACSR